MRGLTNPLNPIRTSGRSRQCLQSLICAPLLSTVLLLALGNPCAAQPTPTAVSVGGGDAFLTEVLNTLERRTNISARIRHQSRLDRHTLVGSGNYWQRGVGRQRTTRWEMQTQVANKSASYLQVFDGSYLWTDRHTVFGRQVHRLDVSRLQSQLRTHSLAPASEIARNQLLRDAEYRGGMSQMLAELAKRFHFDPAHSTQLNGQEVVALIGRWREDQLTQLWPQLPSLENINQADWPEQLPQHVLLLVGQENMFPYLIEYRRAADAYLANSPSGYQPARDPLVRYEVFEVQFATNIDSSLFEFKAGDVQFSDETSAVLERLLRQQQDAVESLARRQEQTAVQ